MVTVFRSVRNELLPSVSAVSAVCIFGTGSIGELGVCRLCIVIEGRSGVRNC